MIYGHGDDGFSADGIITANFSTNVWYGDGSEALVRFLQKRIPLVLHYPEPDADSFVEAVAEHYGVSRDCVLAGNGATELIYLIARAYAGSRTIIFTPSFSEYEDACVQCNHQITFLRSADLPSVRDIENGDDNDVANDASDAVEAGGASVAGDLEAGCASVARDASSGGQKQNSSLSKLPECDLVIIGNPNNPDGKLIPRSEIELFAESHPETKILVDESFIKFTRGDNSILPSIARYPNIIALHSMTKSAAIPGLRLGYMVASEEIVAEVRRFANPWRVNALAVEAGKFLLSRDDHSDEIDLLFERKENFQAAILREKGYEPKYSDTLFFLVKTHYDSHELKLWLRDTHGILIRDCSNFRGLNNHWFRLCTLNEKRNAMLVEALAEFRELQRVKSKE